MSQKVTVIGLGYVGLPLALLTARKGYQVTGLDLDQFKINAVNARRDPIGEAYIAKHVRRTSLKATDQPAVLADSDIAIICVPTPVKNGIQPDLQPVRSATKTIAENLKRGALVIVESTINPGVCDELVIPYIEKLSGLKVNKDFWVAHCPERINPGQEKWTVENIPRVIGASDERGLKRAVKFYESILSASIKPMASLKEAESVKIVENSFRDVNIAFVNELAMSFTKLGVDVKNVIDGAATKPFAFMPHYPSVGVGGHCIPVDPYYLIEYARGYGFEHEFLSLARKINSGMPAYTADRLVEALAEAGKKLRGAKVTVLGLAYKPNVADDRESPSYKLIQILEARGAKVTVYDPYVKRAGNASSLAKAVAGALAIVLATDHQVFKALKPRNLKCQVFIDGRNVYQPADFAGTKIIYRGIGR